MQDSLLNVEAHAPQPKPDSWLRTYLPALRLAVFVALSAFPYSCVSPRLPMMKKDWFGGNQQAAYAQSIIDCSSALLALLLSGFYGRVLDAVGRRPFFLAYAAMLVVEQLALLCSYPNPVPYMILSGFTKLIQTSFMISWLADKYDAERRPTVFPVVTACAIGVGILPGALNIFYDADVVMLVGLGCALVCFIYATLFIEESMEPEEMRSARSGFTFCGALLRRNPFSGISTILSSKVATAAVAIYAASELGNAGRNEICVYYLNQQVGFDTQDNAAFTLEFGLLSPLYLLVLLPLLLKKLSAVSILAGAVASLFAQLVLIAVVWAKWPIFAFIGPLSPVNGWAFPIVLSLLANAGRRDEQGRRQAAATALGDLATAFGPLMFGQLFAALKGQWAGLPFFASGLFLVPAVAVCRWLPSWIRCEAESRRLTQEEEEEEGRPIAA